MDDDLKTPDTKPPSEDALQATRVISELWVDIEDHKTRIAELMQLVRHYEGIVRRG